MKHQIIYKRSIHQHLKTLLVTVVLTGLALCSKAQLNPFQDMYFKNQYLYNPAMAGLDKILNINLNYKQQWTSFPGAPKTSSLTADFQPTDKVGIGLNLNDDQSGFIRSTRIMATYAYHLQLSEQSEQLSFGVSLGVNNSRINYDAVNGDLSDQEIAKYNQLKAYADGDFGVAYTSDKLYIGGALPNLKSAFFKNSDSRFDADRLLFITAASYKISIDGPGQGFVLAPLAAYRVVKGNTDIVDFGANFTMNTYGLYLQSIYHTNQSIGLGFGLDQTNYAFSFNYNLETGQIRTLTGGAFELGLKFKVFQKGYNK